MDVGLCTISNKPAAVEDVIQAAADAGYDGVEIWGEDHVGDGDPDRCRTIAGYARNLGLEIPVYGSYLRPGAESFDEQAIEHELSIADALGSDLIRVWAGTQEYQDRTEAHWSRVVDELQVVVDRAEAADLAVTVEKHGGTVTNTREGARRLIESIEGPCGINYQPLFGTPAGELVEEATDLAPLTNNAHIQAVPEQGSRDRCLLEEAYFDIPALIEALRGGGFDGYVEVEFVTDDQPYETAIELDLEYLRRAV